VDYLDEDGELQFVRRYNSLAGSWQPTYDVMLNFDVYGRGATLITSDGRRTLFALDGDKATPEATEQGSLNRVSGRWVYTSPTNEKYTFDTTTGMGRLVRWTLSDGRSQTVIYADSGPGTYTATVTDSLGHQLSFSVSHWMLTGMMTGELNVKYAYDALGRLSGVTRAWPDRTVSRGYLYEDTKNPEALTGITDERGIRFATWRYDAQGRTVSSEHAGGAGKVTISYNDDSTVVTNALGNAVTYRYRVIQGVKRVTAIEGEPAVGCPASNTQYTYTARGQVATLTNALGVVTTYTYDDMGRETQRIEAKGTPQERTTTTTWDTTRFLPVTVVTAERTVTYVYDPQGRLVTTTEHAN